MTIVGFRKGADSYSAILSVRKHTGRSLHDSKRLIEQVLYGNPVILEDDFVLREELTEQKFIVE